MRREKARGLVNDSVYDASDRVKVKANPEYEIFLAELKRRKKLFVKWQGVAFRAAPLEFARLSKLLDGRGSLKFGGRWSAAGTLRAVNMSLSQEAAIGESGANFTHYNFEASDVRPKVIVGVRLKLGRVIDLRKGKNSLNRGLPLGEMLAEDWRRANDAGRESQSQAFGRAAHDAGAEGLIVPSARVGGGVNLVFFPESLAETSAAEVLGEEELARWLKK